MSMIISSSEERLLAFTKKFRELKPTSAFSWFKRVKHQNNFKTISVFEMTAILGYYEIFNKFMTYFHQCGNYEKNDKHDLLEKIKEALTKKYTTRKDFCSDDFPTRISEDGQVCVNLKKQNNKNFRTTFEFSGC